MSHASTAAESDRDPRDGRTVTTPAEVDDVLVDISDIVVAEDSVAALQNKQIWMRNERDVGH